MAKEKILIVDDEPDIVEPLKDLLEFHGYEVSTASDGEEALKNIAGDTPDLVLLDIRMPGMDGMEALTRITREYPGVLVIMLTAHGTIDLAVEAMKQGADGFLEKPFADDITEKIEEKIEEIKKRVKREIDKTFEKQEVKAGLNPREGLKYSYDEIIGNSPKLLNVLREIDKVADSDATVLILGDSGTGKELVAEALHQNSGRSKKPFEVIQCAAIPKDLLESELFGSKRGAFTGAVDKKGMFERADGGTLFFDEIGEMPLELQAKLLRAIEGYGFEKVGGEQVINVDVRIVAATNRDLPKAVTEGDFRSDLYYRLNMVTIELPLLRERKEDIPILAAYFLEKYRVAHKRPVRKISRKAMEMLEEYDWPGNIRELNNYIGKAVLYAEGAVILPQHLPVAQQDQTTPTATEIPVGLTMKEIEKEVILKTLEACEGNRTQTAKTLGMGLRTVQNRLKEYGLVK